jgi:3-hydroxybutyryl-CoA dehydratase
MNEYKFSELKVDDEKMFSATITKEMMDQFLALSGDSNPLHQDPAYACERGFKDRVVYGFLTSAFYSTLVGVHLPGKYALLQGVKKINFLKPVFVGDQLRIYGKISYVNEAYKVAEIKARIINQKEELVSDAIINVGLLA